MRLVLAILAALAVQISAPWLEPPFGLDIYMPVPESNPLSAQAVDEGRRLFFDRRLSRDGSVSCATCHQPEHAFADDRRIAVGIDGRVGRRNAPAIINRGYGRLFFWDGRGERLEDQVLKPIEDPNEMDILVADAAARVGLAPDALSRALASYVRSIRSGNSRFDRFATGDAKALTEDEQLGLRIFRGKGRCVTCHIGPTFTDEKLHNTGVAWDGERLIDSGAGRGEFKTPTLREVAQTAPYMHDGSLATLRDVVDFYDRGGRPNPHLDRELRPLALTDDEARTLVTFLSSLSGSVTR